MLNTIDIYSISFSNCHLLRMLRYTARVHAGKRLVSTHNHIRRPMNERDSIPHRSASLPIYKNRRHAKNKLFHLHCHGKYFSKCFLFSFVVSISRTMLRSGNFRGAPIDSIIIPETVISLLFYSFFSPSLSSSLFPSFCFFSLLFLIFFFFLPMTVYLKKKKRNAKIIICTGRGAHHHHEHHLAEWVGIDKSSNIVL